MTLDDVRTPSSLLLEQNVQEAGGRQAHRYWPLQWFQAGEVPLGYSADDLTLLGELGRKLLAAAGLQPADVLANLLAPRPTREYWQFLLGAQAAGLSSVFVGPGRPVEEIDLLAPTVLVGEAAELARALEVGGALDLVHTVIVVGQPPATRERRRLVAGVGGNESAVVRAWAPDGVLALWAQCRGGNGFHSWPDVEIVELVDPVSGLLAPAEAPGLVTWTGTGWYASAIVRLRTDSAAMVHHGVCPTCGRSSPRIEPCESAPGFATVLDANPHVMSWIAELQRTDDGDELVIWLAPDAPSSAAAMLTDLDAEIGPARVLLVDKEEVEHRLADAKGERFGDRRAFPDLEGQHRR